MSSKFPKTIFVTTEVDEDGDAFLMSSETLDFHASPGRVSEVAKYELVEVGEVHSESSFVVTDKIRRP